MMMMMMMKWGRGRRSRRRRKKKKRRGGWKMERRRTLSRRNWSGRAGVLYRSYKASHSFWLLLWGQMSSVISCLLARILQVWVPFLPHSENYQILTHVPVHALSYKLCSVHCPRPKHSSLMDDTLFQVRQDLTRSRDTKAQRRKRTTGLRGKWLVEAHARQYSL